MASSMCGGAAGHNSTLEEGMADRTGVFGMRAKCATDTVNVVTDSPDS